MIDGLVYVRKEVWALVDAPWAGVKLSDRPLARWEFLLIPGAGWEKQGGKYGGASGSEPDTATRKLHYRWEMYVSGMCTCKPSARFYFWCMAQSFINYYIIFAVTCRWKVGVWAVVSAAVSGEDRAATILPAFNLHKATFFCQSRRDSMLYWKSYSNVGSFRATCLLVSVKTSFGNMSASYIHNRSLLPDFNTFLIRCEARSLFCLFVFTFRWNNWIN